MFLLSTRNLDRVAAIVCFSMFLNYRHGHLIMGSFFWANTFSNSGSFTVYMLFLVSPLLRYIVPCISSVMCADIRQLSAPAYPDILCQYLYLTRCRLVLNMLTCIHTCVIAVVPSPLPITCYVYQYPSLSALALAVSQT